MYKEGGLYTSTPNNNIEWALAYWPAEAKKNANQSCFGKCVSLHPVTIRIGYSLCIWTNRDTPSIHVNLYVVGYGKDSMNSPKIDSKGFRKECLSNWTRYWSVDTV